MNNRSLSRGAAALARLAENTGYTGERTVYLGTTVGQVIADAERRLVFWHDEQVEGVAVLPQDAGIPLRLAETFAGKRLRVRIARPPRRTTYYVIEIDEVGLTSLGGLTPTDRVIGQSLLPKYGQIDTLRVVPTTPPSKAAEISGIYLYLDSSNALQSSVDTALDLSASIAALTAGQHQLGIVCLDQATGDLALASASAVSAIDELPARSEFDLSHILNVTLAATYRPLCAIYLYNGQEALVEDDLYRAYNMPRFETRSTSLNLSSPPPIGDVAPNTGDFTTFTATGLATFGSASNTTIATNGQIKTTHDTTPYAIVVENAFPGFYLIETSASRRAFFVLDGSAFQIQARDTSDNYLNSNLAVDLSNNLVAINYPTPSDFNSTFTVRGLSDVIQARIRGHSTQTNPILQVEDVNGVLYFTVPGAGGARIHNDPGAGATSTLTLTNATGTPSNTITPTGYIKVYVGTTARYIPYYT